LNSAETNLFERVMTSRANPDAVRHLVAQFAPLAELARSIEQQGRDLVDREVLALQDKAEQARQLVLWQLLALIPVVLFLVTGFTLLIAKPIRQIESAIR